MKCILFLEPLERCGPAHALIQGFWFPELQENKGVLYHLVCGNFFPPSYRGLPNDAASKNLPVSVGDADLTPDPGRSPEDGNGNTLHDSCQENPMDRGAQQATVHEVIELDVTE